MLGPALLDRLFDAFSIQRWNDQVRPLPLVEMDKHAHKMAAVYCLARAEEDAGRAVDWPRLVEGGVFELLRQSVLSDIMSPVYRRLERDHPAAFRDLTTWVVDRLQADLEGTDLLPALKACLLEEVKPDPLVRDLLAAAHTWATLWEFHLLKPFQGDRAEMRHIEAGLLEDLRAYEHLAGLSDLLEHRPLAAFLDRFGRLRCQVRWGQTVRVPPTSVLGHSLLVAIVAWLLVREMHGCPRRLRNAFFGGLFHDLPEAVTRDIISPVKGAVSALPDALKAIEQALVREQLEPLLPPAWREEFAYFTEDEFATKIRRDGAVEAVPLDDLQARCDDDRYNPCDGEAIRVADHLAAYLEASHALAAGIRTPTLVEGGRLLAARYDGFTLAGLPVGRLFR